jgi:transcriptional regulator with XRE-family HTH domain
MDLPRELALARMNKGFSQASLAHKLNFSRLVIARLEAGVGSVPRLLTVMKFLEFRLSGIARGSTLPEQLRARREQKGLSVHDIARQSGLTSKTIEVVEHGGGSVASLLKLLAAIAPAARQSRPVRSSWAFDGTQMEERDKRFTPFWFFEKITECFGPVDLDPCAHPLSAVIARRTISLPECGLSTQWSGRLAYVNPPFSSVVKWMDRAAKAWERGEVETIVMLVPARTDSVRTPVLKGATHRPAPPG